MAASFSPERIRALRERLDCEQEEFGRLLGVPTATLSRWENDRAAPDPTAQKRLERLAQQLEAGADPVRLKTRLLLADVLAGEGIAPVELLRIGSLEAVLRQGLEDHGLFEALYLDGSFDFGDLIDRQVTAWFRALEEGHLQVADPPAWEEVLRFAEPIARLLYGLLWDPTIPLPDPHRGKVGYALTFFLRPRPRVADRIPRAVGWPAFGVRGYADDLAEGLRAIQAYRTTLESGDYEAASVYERIEALWSEQCWSGPESFQALYPDLLRAVRERVQHMHPEDPFAERWRTLSVPGADPPDEGEEGPPVDG